MKKTADGVCQVCGAGFVSRPDRVKRGWSATCSVACGRKLMSRRCSEKRGVCVRCGSEMPPGNKKYCSSKCYSDQYSAERTTLWTCQKCGASRKMAKSLAVMTLCASCFGKSVSKEANPNWRGGIEKQCATCAKPVWVSPARMRDNEEHYCCKECFWKSHKLRQNGKTRAFGNTIPGKRKDLGLYFRSSWEANYARYLNWLMDKGEISDWEYEPARFEFTGIKRGVMSYLPDFKVCDNKNRIEYHEIKGYMTQKSATALKRMAKYYPSVDVKLIGQREYRDIARSVAKIIPNWEMTSSGRRY